MKNKLECKITAIGVFTICVKSVPSPSRSILAHRFLKDTFLLLLSFSFTFTAQQGCLLGFGWLVSLFNWIFS